MQGQIRSFVSSNEEQEAHTPTDISTQNGLQLLIQTLLGLP